MIRPTASRPARRLLVACGFASVAMMLSVPLGACLFSGNAASGFGDSRGSLLLGGSAPTQGEQHRSGASAAIQPLPNGAASRISAAGIAGIGRPPFDSECVQPPSMPAWLRGVDSCAWHPASARETVPIGPAITTAREARGPLVGTTLTTSPNSSAVGSWVDVNGTGFPANSPVLLSLGGVAVGQNCSSDKLGDIVGPSGTTCTFPVPTLPGGSETLTAGLPPAAPLNSVPITVGNYPSAVVFDPHTDEEFVAFTPTSTGPTNVSVISDTNDSFVTNVSVNSSASNLAFDPSTDEVFVSGGDSNNVSVIADGNDTVVANIDVGGFPGPLVYDPATRQMFVLITASDNVSVISDRTDTVVATIAVGAYPYALADDYGTGDVYVANTYSANVSVISGISDTVVATIGVGSFPGDVLYDPGTDQVFVANFFGQTVSSILDSSDVVQTTINMPGTPLLMAYDPRMGQVSVVNYNPNGSQMSNVSILADRNDSILTTIAVGSYPGSVTYDSATDQIIVPNQGSDNVSVISGWNDSFLASFPLGSYPGPSAFDPSTSQVFVVNAYSSNLSVLKTPYNLNASTGFGVSPALRLAVAPGPNSVDIGQTFTLEGGGFGAQLSLNATFGGLPISCSATAMGTCVGGILGSDPNGAFLADFIAPNATAGVQNITVSEAGGLSATTSIAVYPAPQIGNVTASPSSVDLGQTTTFSVGGISGGSGSLVYVWKGLPTSCVASSVASVACTPDSAGNYSVAVELVDSNGFMLTSRPFAFAVYRDPKVSTPVGQPGSGFADVGQNVTFQAHASLGSGTYPAYAWTGLPAGCTGATAIVVCVGSELVAGTYAVIATVTDSNGFTSNESPALVYTINAIPVTETPQSTQPSADVGQNVTFSEPEMTGSPSWSYSWRGLPSGCFGATSRMVSCDLRDSGVYNVSVGVDDPANTTVVSGTLVFLVYPDPTVTFSLSRQLLDVGQYVSLSATVENGSGNDSFQWHQLPPGCGETGASVACAPTGSGSYPVRVQVIDSNGFSVNSTAAQLTINPAITAKISTSPSGGMLGENSTFWATASGGSPPLTYAWNFGDGSTGAGAVAYHSYTRAGNFSVALWVNDTAGSSVEKNAYVVVAAATTGGATGPANYLPIFVAGVLVVGLAASAVVIRRRTARRRTNAGSTGESEADKSESAPATEESNHP